jgi:hypothetical protein
VHAGADAGCYDCSKVAFPVTVTNTGRVAGETAVLGFVETITPGGVAVRSLFDFTRVSLAAGGSTTITLQMDAGYHAFSLNFHSLSPFCLLV